MTPQEMGAALDAALADPSDALSCFALADAHEQQGHTALAFAWRWMGWHQRRPLLHPIRGGRRFGWHRASKEPYSNKHPACSGLPSPLLDAMGNPRVVNVRVCIDLDHAVFQLALALERLRQILQPPEV